MANRGNEIYPVQNLPDALKYHTFTCHFSNCNASYRRKEHLNRHEARHSQQQSFVCSTCGHRFGRSDTLRRHVQRRHKINEPLKRAVRACDSCRSCKTRCDGGVPCDECLRRKIQCSLHESTGSVKKQRPEASAHREAGLGHDQPQSHRSKKENQYIDLYFQSFHPSWCFIHKGSFDVRREAPLLVQSMTVLGLWASGEQSAQSSAIELHATLGLAIQNQKDKWDVSRVEKPCSTCFWPIPTYQAILLHIIFSCVVKSRGALDIELKVSLSRADFGLLESLVRSCRKLGMFYYPNILARYKEAHLASFVWVGIEETKRFNLALYKLCGRVRGSSIGDSGSGGNNDAASLLPASELQFPMPNNRPLWNAVGKNEWLANTNVEESLAGLDDNLQASSSWISNSADVLESLEF